jgi:ABC-2 type transport system ATP-binding protein
LSSAIIANDVSRIYRSASKEKIALRDFSIEVRESEIFSILGRNGAGKTTFLRIASTSLAPSSGKLEVLGLDVVTQADELRKRIAVIPQEARPMEFITPFEHIFYYLIMRGMNRAEARLRTNKIIDELDLTEYGNIRSSHLSGGIRQKILVAMGLATDAELLFLDEPTLGLDPISRRDVWSIIRKAKNDGKTVLLTTHYMEEAEELSDQVAIIHNGKGVLQASIEEAKRILKARTRVSIETDSPEKDFSQFGETSRLRDSLAIFTENPEQVIAYALSKGLRVTARPISLEDVFLKLVGEIEDEREV